MGYSRVGSPLLCRASRPWTFAGYSDAGSTCLPSFGMLATAVDDLLWSVGTRGVKRPRAPASKVAARAVLHVRFGSKATIGIGRRSHPCEESRLGLF